MILNQNLKYLCDEKLQKHPAFLRYSLRTVFINSWRNLSEKKWHLQRVEVTLQ